MRIAIRAWALAWSALAAAGGAAAQPDAASNPMPAVRADRWAEAQAIADRAADPVAARIVRYYRMLAPGAASAAEIARFQRDNPDWPAPALLDRRRQEALAAEPNPAAAAALCAESPPQLPSAALRCADAFARAGQEARARAQARAAWVDAIAEPALEAAFLRQWADVPSAADEWDRFRRLAWRDSAAAARQAARLDTALAARADLPLALRRDDPAAETAWTAAPAEWRRDPAATLERAKFLRRRERLAEAAALWVQDGARAQADAADHLGDFWTERHGLVRRLLRAADYANAYAVLRGHGQASVENAVEAEFLAGFVALRFLRDPSGALRHFEALSAASPAAITQGRAWYWIGRAQAELGRDPAPAWRRAAGWSATFYGQMAAIALDEGLDARAGRVLAARDPAWDQATANRLATHDLLRAAGWLSAWGETGRIRPFLVRMDELAKTMPERAFVASFALRTGSPDGAVFVARRIGRDGGMVVETGWPMPFDPPPDSDAAAALAVMRQESSFDPAAVSSSGARGLMQLMPATAREVARKLSIQTSLPTLTADTAHNMRLGTTYLRDMRARFGGSLPLAAAAYNAGPHRVDQWLAEYGDPRVGGVAMLDWLELIPFNETRNYVQRVLENAVVYRAKRGEREETLSAAWAEAR